MMRAASVEANVRPFFGGIVVLEIGELNLCRDLTAEALLGVA